MIIVLPVPPSVNAAYANVPRVGRVKTAAYKAWIRQADGYVLSQKARIKPVSGPCEISIRVPLKMRGDVSNRIKLAEDYLVSRGITGDDRNNRKVSIERADVSECEIEIIEVSDDHC